MMMAKINKEIAKLYQRKDVRACDGNGYIYFDGDDGFDQIQSIMMCPKSVDFAQRRKVVIEHVKNHFRT